MALRDLLAQLAHRKTMELAGRPLAEVEELESAVAASIAELERKA